MNESFEIFEKSHLEGGGWVCSGSRGDDFPFINYNVKCKENTWKSLLFELLPNFQSTPRASQMRFFKNFKRFVNKHPRTVRIQVFRSVAPLGEVRRILEFVYPPPLRYGIEITTFILESVSRLFFVQGGNLR